MSQKVAIVTGASSGIGAATARALVEAGYKVTLAARRKERLEALAAELGDSALVCQTDVTIAAQVDAMVEQTVAHFGRVDALINNAGIMPLSFMRNLHREEWTRMVDVNINGPLNGIGAVLPIFREQGSGDIVNISSVAGRRVFPAGAVYCGTKSALNAISEGLRQELAAEGKRVRVILIEPGATATELGDHITDPEKVNHYASRAKEIDFLQPEDIARAVVYAIAQPDWVDVAELLVMPTDQA